MTFDILTDIITKLDLKGKIAKTEGGERIKYEKLVFVIGSLPYVPEWFKGTELDRVFNIRKTENTSKNSRNV